MKISKCLVGKLHRNRKFESHRPVSSDQRDPRTRLLNLNIQLHSIPSAGPPFAARLFPCKQTVDFLMMTAASS